ncbi:MAG: ATP cone domain-containing protein [Minisyncoccia bacterium]
MPYLIALKDGRIVEFNKVDVRKAISRIGRRAYLSPEHLDDLADKISTELTRYMSKKKIVSSEEIHEKILLYLDVFEPELSEMWRKYEKRSRKRILY